MVGKLYAIILVTKECHIKISSRSQGSQQLQSTYLSSVFVCPLRVLLAHCFGPHKWYDCYDVLSREAHTSDGSEIHCLSSEKLSHFETRRRATNSALAVEYLNETDNKVLAYFGIVEVLPPLDSHFKFSVVFKWKLGISDEIDSPLLWVIFGTSGNSKTKWKYNLLSRILNMKKVTHKKA